MIIEIIRVFLEILGGLFLIGLLVEIASKFGWYNALVRKIQYRKSVFDGKRKRERLMKDTRKIQKYDKGL